MRLNGSVCARRYEMLSLTALISHMGIVVLGTFAMNAEGITGSVFLMLSHGIVSTSLFMLVGMIYDRRHTKLMSDFGGLVCYAKLCNDLLHYANGFSRLTLTRVL